MLPSPAEIEAARRALKAIEEGGHPSRVDALTLRLWSGPRHKMGPLEEIAKNILKAEGESPSRP